MCWLTCVRNDNGTSNGGFNVPEVCLPSLSTERQALFCLDFLFSNVLQALADEQHATKKNGHAYARHSSEQHATKHANASQAQAVKDTSKHDEMYNWLERPKSRCG
jgi:hypothetical protein